MKNLALLSLTLMILYSCGSVPVTGRRQLNLVSDAEVLSLSLTEYNEYIKTAKKSTNAANTAMVTNVGSRIAQAVEAYYKYAGLESELSNFAWEFTLVEDDQVNAFCMPGGKIVVYSGILPVTQNETGLAVVLGHEVGHAVAKHASERMSNQMALQYGAAGLDALLSRSSSTIRTAGQTVFGLGAQIGIMTPYNHKQELEADFLGMVFMGIAGYSPEAALPFWERMSQLSGGSQVPAFLSTHPSDATRINGIRQKLPEAMDYYKAIHGNKTNTTTTPTQNTNTNTNSQWRF